MEKLKNLIINLIEIFFVIIEAIYQFAIIMYLYLLWAVTYITHRKSIYDWYEYYFKNK